MGKYIDLHTHTTHSDGTLTPLDLVKHSYERGLSAVAVTDHNCVSGISEATETASAYGLEVVPGIEISAKEAGMSVHVLGLLIDYKNMTFTKRLENVASFKSEIIRRDQLIINKLTALGIHGLSFVELCDTLQVSLPKKLHIGQYLVKKGVVKSTDEAMEKFLNTGCPAYVESNHRHLSVAEAISLIHSANGIAIWAHPILCEPSLFGIEEKVIEFKNKGLDGIEVYHSDHTKTEMYDLLQLAQKYALSISGGSDFHGLHNPKRVLGYACDGLQIPYSLLDNLYKRKLK